MLHDYPDGVDDPRDVAEQRKKDIQPEVDAKADLQEHAQRRQKDGEDDTNNIHRRVGLQMLFRGTSHILNMRH